MYVNSRFKATKIIGQRKVSSRQRIPESSCTRKETVDIDILVTSRNGDRQMVINNPVIVDDQQCCYLQVIQRL